LETVLSAIMPDITTSTTTHAGPVTYPSSLAPSWATSYDDSSQGTVTWSHKVELSAVEVDNPQSLTVQACVYDSVEADIELGVRIDRGSPEIQITRLDADGKQDRNEVLLRFEIANAHRVIAAIQKCCGAIESNVEGNTVATT
jgi:hypothetical protein